MSPRTHRIDVVIPVEPLRISVPLDLPVEPVPVPMPIEPIAVRVDAAAELLDLSPGVIRGWVRDGSIPSFRAGRAIRIPVAGLREAVARMASGEQEPIGFEPWARRRRA